MQQLATMDYRDNSNTVTPGSSSLLHQVIFSLIASSTTIASGMNLGFSAIALPVLTTPGSQDFLDKDQSSWFASITSIATPVGCLLCGPMLDKFGRRVALLALNVPFLVGWLLLALAPSPSPVELLYLGRIFTGLGTGMASIPGCVYIAEMTESRLRGMLVTWPSIGISLGILLIYILGTILPESWRIVAGISAVFPILAMVTILLLLQESPMWLMAKEKQQEFLKIESSKQVQGQDEPVTSSPTTVQSPSCKETICLLLRSECWKPLFVLNCFFFFQQFTGIYVVVYYAVDVVIQAGVGIDAYITTVLLGVVQLISGIAVSFALTRYGRRPMSVLSGVGMTMCMLGLAVYLQLVPNGSETARSSPNLALVPFFFLLLYVIAGAIGFHTLPWAMLGEMFPSKVKGLAGGLTTCLAYVFSFLALKMYPYLSSFIGGVSNEGVFYYFGIISLIATVFVYLFLTETHGKSLDDIEQEFVTQPVLKPFSCLKRQVNDCDG